MVSVCVTVPGGMVVVPMVLHGSQALKQVSTTKGIDETIRARFAKPTGTAKAGNLLRTVPRIAIDELKLIGTRCSSKVSLHS